MDNDILEGYMIRGGISYDSLSDGMWVLHDDVQAVDNIVVTYAPPVVLFRVKLMELPPAGPNRAALCERLLELNASAMVAGAYGIDGDAVIASETLQAADLDFSEFQAAIEGLTLAITEHYDELKQFHTGAKASN